MTNQTTYGKNAIRVGGTSENITVERCHFTYGNGTFIELYELTKNIIVQDNYFYGMLHSGASNHQPRAVDCRGIDTIIKNNFIKNTWGVGICGERNTSSPQTQSKYFLIDGNYITGEVSVGIYCEGGPTSKSTNFTIINNVIRDINGSAYHNEEGTWRWSRGIFCGPNSIVSHNTISGVDCTGIDIGRDASVIMRNRPTIVSDNIINNVYNTSGDGGILVACNGTIIKGNILTDIASANAAIYTSEGFVTDVNNDTYAVTAEGNYIYASRCLYGIRGVSSVIGNTIILTKALAVGVYMGGVISNNNITAPKGITFPASSYRNSIVSNNRMDVTTYGIYAASCSNMSITGNYIHGAYGSTDPCLSLTSSRNMSVMNNIITSGKRGIYESGTSDWNIIIGNVVTTMSTSCIDTSGANTIAVYNRGLVV